MNGAAGRSRTALDEAEAAGRSARFDRGEYDRRGLIRLPGAVPPRDVEQMRSRVWQELHRRSGASPGHPESWPSATPAHFQSLTGTGAFDAMASPSVLSVIEELVGRHRWLSPDHWGRPLVTFPQAGPWHLPSRGWHQDSSDRPGDPLLVVFVCLDVVRPAGGGTLVVAGSHRLTAPGSRYAGLRSAQVRDHLAADSAWFHDLLTPGQEPARTERLRDATCIVDGIDLDIVELTGAAGDAFLMHPRLLHAVAPNALDTPRLMLLHFVRPVD